MLVAGRAVEIPDLVSVVNGKRARDGRALGVEGHVEPRVLAEIVEHIREILRLARDKAVAHAGRQHEIGERRNHFLAADLHAYALALGQANIIAPFLVEGRHKLIFRFALDVQTEDIARLDGLKILPALLAPEAERLHERGECRVARRHVRVELDNI